jgi:hypothetical protein
MSADMQEYSRQLNLLGAVSCFKQVFALFFNWGFPKQSIKLARLAGWMARQCPTTGRPANGYVGT